MTVSVNAPQGKVCLVGAGPGAPDLITVRGLSLLRAADVIVCDHLVAGDFLERLGLSEHGRKLVRLGRGQTRDEGEALLALMRDEALAGKTVVRLKGGDPGVFGRMAEELAALSQWGIPWEVVPGPSVSTAACTAAGIPVTRRGDSRSLGVVTARTRGGDPNAEMPRADTLVIYMGVECARDTASTLLEQGWSADTPCLAIESATLPFERRVLCRLAEIQDGALNGVRSPAILVVGMAAACTAARPRILFAGADPAPYRCLGDLLHWPAFRTVQRTDLSPVEIECIDSLARAPRGRKLNPPFPVIAFADADAVSAFVRLLDTKGLDVRVLFGVPVAAAETGAVSRLLEHGIRADHLWLGRNAPSRSGLIVGSNAGISRLLERAPWGRWTRFVTHEHIPSPELNSPLPDHDAILFASDLERDAYVRAYGPNVLSREIWTTSPPPHDARRVVCPPEGGTQFQ